MEFGIFGWWLMLAALFQFSSIHACLREEREALLRLKASFVNSSDVDFFTSWNSSQEGRNCCNWEHVMCDNTTGRVIKLDLEHIDSYLESLPRPIRYLNASLFIPFQELKYLDLSWNGISGWLPNEGFKRLSGLSKLEVLDFSENYINESFLSSLGQLLSLKKLYLTYNLLDRPINMPITELGRLKNLQELYLDGSYIDKSFLSKVGVMTSLNVLTIRKCGLNGSLPIVQGLCELMNLRLLDLSQNNFEGILPSCLTSLRVLDLSSNNFSGTISETLAMGCSSLYYLRLSKNRLSGQLFSANLNLTALQYLYLDNNHFSGEISHSISNLTSLQVIDFSNNSLLGMLPRWMGNMTSLRDIAIAKNHLEGPIPVELCNLKSLSFLDLSHNNLSGSIPSCSNGSEIKHVHLKKNRLTGPISSAFKGCSALVTLNLNDNYLTGNIPDWIDNLSSLSILLLKANYLQGKIPFQICHLEQLSLLDLSNNSFSGQIPDCLSNIRFEPTSTKFEMPIILNFYRSSLDPSLFLKYAMIMNEQGMPVLHDQTSMSGMVEVQKEVEFSTKNRILSDKGDILNYMSGIDLSCNKLEGEIPTELGDLSNIHALNLSFNNLTGSIPTEFSKLKQIESLDLSHNNLDGIIPPQLVELNSLAVFQVAHNNLRGTTPERKAQFSTFDESSYEGNPLLCGPPLKACTKIQTDEAYGFMDYEVFYISFAVSYTMVLLEIVAILYINPHWRQDWFNFVELCMSTCYNFVVINTRSYLALELCSFVF